MQSHSASSIRPGKLGILTSKAWCLGSGHLSCLRPIISPPNRINIRPIANATSA